MIGFRPKFEQQSATSVTNRKLHMSFRLVPTSVTLTGVIALILRYLTEFDSFAGRLRYSGWR